MTVDFSKRLNLRDVVYMQVLVYYSRLIFQKVPWSSMGFYNVPRWNVLECSGNLGKDRYHKSCDLSYDCCTITLMLLSFDIDLVFRSYFTASLNDS
jgi:hypothetical protein